MMPISFTKIGAPIPGMGVGVMVGVDVGVGVTVGVGVDVGVGVSVGVGVKVGPNNWPGPHPERNITAGRRPRIENRRSRCILSSRSLSRANPAAAVAADLRHDFGAFEAAGNPEMG